MIDTISDRPPTLREILFHKKPTDSDIIDVSKLNPKDPKNPKLLYHGLIDTTPDDILNLRISAWIKKTGFIYLNKLDRKVCI